MKQEGDGDVPRAFVVLKPEFSSVDKDALTEEIDTLIEARFYFEIHYIEIKIIIRFGLTNSLNTFSWQHKSLKYRFLQIFYVMTIFS